MTADGPDPTAEFAALDAREALYSDALEQADRLANLGAATRLQVMLAGFDAMLIEERGAGQAVRQDDPVVRGFLLHQATVLRTSRFDVQQRLYDARTVRDALPSTWGVFLQGACSERLVGIVADQSAGIAPQTLIAFDLAAAEIVQHERPKEVERRLSRLRDELEPEAAADRHRHATSRRHVRARLERDGQAVLEIHSTSADAAAAYDVIRRAAVAAHGREGECRTLGQLMADIAVDMILQAAAVGSTHGDDPSYPMERLGSTVAPERRSITAELLVTVSADVATGAADGAASIAGMGSVDGDVARRIVQHTATWTRVLVDPVEDAVLGIDTHERYIPKGLKKLIHARNASCTGDDCGLPSHRTDLDHVTRFEHDGRTRHDNLQPVCRASHQIKDEGCWDVRIVDGDIRWRSRWGATRVVKPALKIATARVAYPDEAPF